jgi:hypothetical protein
MSAFKLGAQRLSAVAASSTPRLRGKTLLPVAALLAAVILVGPQELDPIPEWRELK